eukprot:scaffold1093_cov359-Prasinococcus_capsulatus_cf.AAC.16
MPPAPLCLHSPRGSPALCGKSLRAARREEASRRRTELAGDSAPHKYWAQGRPVDRRRRQHTRARSAAAPPPRLKPLGPRGSARSTGLERAAWTIASWVASTPDPRRVAGAIRSVSGLTHAAPSTAASVGGARSLSQGRSLGRPQNDDAAADVVCLFVWIGEGEMMRASAPTSQAVGGGRSP